MKNNEENLKEIGRINNIEINHNFIISNIYLLF